MSYYLDADALLIRSRLPLGVEPPEGADSLFILYAVLMRVKGEQVSLSDVHDAWSAWMLLRGETHRSIVPFERLDKNTQDEDRPYLEAIRQAARSRE
ncbi:MAG TPA: hypothetical protein VFX16_15690 [Pseudonocardiaceae bacterium]|nr:hypothetical protein [Pseudonocardiaceae bacterium]